MYISFSQTTKTNNNKNQSEIFERDNSLFRKEIIIIVFATKLYNNW